MARFHNKKYSKLFLALSKKTPVHKKLIKRENDSENDVWAERVRKSDGDQKID